jgi:LCP family protein required for cell wall assembly
VTVAIVLFLVGLVHGALTIAGIAGLRGRRAVDPTGRRRRQRSGAKVVLGLVALGVSLTLFAVEAGWFYANARWEEVERVDVDVDGESVLAGGSGGTNYLLVGTDNRPGVEGNRSDTMLVLRTGDGPAKLMSIPRDLLVPIPTRDDGGELHRINAAYNDGPTALIRTVQESVGIPIDRYIEINFVSFGDLVDALGGVTINFPNPAFDEKSGLNVEQSGPVRLDGEQALAYVRSRTYTEVIDGSTVTDPTADLGRVQRQQMFLRAVLAETGSNRNPFKLNEIGTSLIGGLKVDNHMTLLDALRFAWQMGDLDPQPTELPTTIDGAFLQLQQPEAQAVIDDFSS